MSVLQIAPGQTRIGWIGTGVMGSSMCGHLLAAGFSVTVYNRSRSKAEALLPAAPLGRFAPGSGPAKRRGVHHRGLPGRRAPGDPGRRRRFGRRRPGMIVVDMTTSQPALAIEIAAAAARQGVDSLDAPVSGGDVGAREARLSIMIGGQREAVDALKPCWQAMGKTIVYQGGPGAGQHTKLVNQILIAANMIGVCEALLYAYRAGLDAKTVLQSVGSGAAGSWSLANLGPRIIANRFEPGFFVEHFIKDMGIALEESRRLGLCLPGLALANQLYLAVQAQGRGRDGTHALELALAAMSGVDWPNRQRKEAP